MNAIVKAACAALALALTAGGAQAQSQTQAQTQAPAQSQAPAHENGGASAAWRAGLAQAVGAPPPQEGALCESFGRTYRAWLAGRGGDANATRSGPLAMRADPASGFSLVQPLAAMPAGKVAAWAAAQKPPLPLPAAAADWLDVPERRPIIEQVPGGDFYALSALEGSAHCYDALYFRLENGVAREVDPPPNWSDDDGAGCGVRRGLARLGDSVVAYEDESDSGPDLRARVSLSGWTGAGFGPACAIAFDYAPRFSDELANAWDQACAGPRCPALRAAARRLAESVQMERAGARAAALAALAPEERRRFVAAYPESDKADDSPPDAPTDQAPVVLPLELGGALYAAAVGHFTIGWRRFADWSVKFENLDDPRDKASFAIGMSRGALVGAAVR